MGYYDDVYDKVKAIDFAAAKRTFEIVKGPMGTFIRIPLKLNFKSGWATTVEGFTPLDFKNEKLQEFMNENPHHRPHIEQLVRSNK